MFQKKNYYHQKTFPVNNLKIWLSLALTIAFVFMAGPVLADDPLFEVTNSAGQTIFAVYPDGIEVTTAEGQKIMSAVEDSIRFFLTEETQRGFARSLSVGSAGAGRDLESEIFTVDLKGMRVANRDGEKIMTAVDDSIRFFVTDSTTTRGFARSLSVGSAGAGRDLSPEIFSVDFEGIEVENSEGQTIMTAAGNYIDLLAQTTMGSSNNDASGLYATAFGDNCSAWGDYSIAAGFGSEVGDPSGEGGGTAAMALGSNCYVYGDNSMALGYNCNTDGNATMAFGNNCYAGGDNSIALGSYAQTDYDGGGSFVFGDASTQNILVADTTNQFLVRAGGGYEFYTDPSLTITQGIFFGPNGNVGIGTTAPPGADYKMHVIGNISVFGNIDVQGYITSWPTPSDIRYKKDIVTLDNALDKLLKLRGINYSWRSSEFPAKKFSPGRQIGFVAQEIEQVQTENAALKAQITKFSAQSAKIDQMAAKMAQLEAALHELQASSSAKAKTGNNMQARLQEDE